MQVNKREVLKIEEYKYKDISLNIDKDLPYLRKDCFKISSSSPPFNIIELKDNKVRIHNTSYSGIIQLDKERLHFSEKVKVNLFYMMSFLKDEENFYYDPDVIIEIEEGINFFDILGRLFLNELVEIEKKGFYKKYVKKEENLNFLRGKIQFRNQIINDIKKIPKFYCQYSDLTFDNLENQIILKATTLLIPLIKFNMEIRSELLKYSNLLKENISLVNVIPEDCNKVQYSRLNDYYKTIIQFSKVILQNYFIRSKFKGAAKGFNFIVNMNKVFEDFISTIIEDILKSDKDFKFYRVETQRKFNSLVKEKSIGTRPDIILGIKDKPNTYPYIIDTKYKKDVSNADYFQIIAYALEIPDSKACALIYPIYENVEDTVLTLNTESFGKNREDIKLYTIKINLFLGEDLSFEEYILKIKGEVKEKLLKFVSLN